MAFVLLALAFTFGLWKWTTLEHSNHKLAASAHRIALKQAADDKRRAADDKRTKALRVKQLRLLHQVAVKGCQRQHKLTLVVERLDERLIKQSEQQAAFPGLTPEQERVLKIEQQRSLATLKQFLVDLRRADCVVVPKLPMKAPG